MRLRIGFLGLSTCFSRFFTLTETKNFPRLQPLFCSYSAYSKMGYSSQRISPSYSEFVYGCALCSAIDLKPCVAAPPALEDVCRAKSAAQRMGLFRDCRLSPKHRATTCNSERNRSGCGDARGYLTWRTAVPPERVRPPWSRQRANLYNYSRIRPILYDGQINRTSFEKM
jgi:hypothetical protein